MYSISPSAMGCNITIISGFSFVLDDDEASKKECITRFKKTLPHITSTGWMLSVSEEQWLCPFMSKLLAHFSLGKIPGSHGKYYTHIYGGSTKALKEFMENQ